MRARLRRWLLAWLGVPQLEAPPAYILGTCSFCCSLLYSHQPYLAVVRTGWSRRRIALACYPCGRNRKTLKRVIRGEPQWPEGDAMKTLADAKRRFRVGTKVRVTHHLWPDLSRDTECLKGTGPTSLVMGAKDPTKRSWASWPRAKDVKVDGDSVTFLRGYGQDAGLPAFTVTILQDAPTVTVETPVVVGERVEFPWANHEPHN